MKIYLAGKIPKGIGSDKEKNWRDIYTANEEIVKKYKILIPIIEGLDYNLYKEVFGHDCLLIKSADIIVVDASRKLGIGTSQEMIIAKYFNKFVFTVLPKDTHHRRRMLNFNKIDTIPDWIHPFIRVTSDMIFSSHDECINYLKEFNVESTKNEATSIAIIDEAIELYLSAHNR